MQFYRISPAHLETYFEFAFPLLDIGEALNIQNLMRLMGLLFQGNGRLSVGINFSELLRKAVCTSTGADANVRTKCGKGNTNHLAHFSTRHWSEKLSSQGKQDGTASSCTFFMWWICILLAYRSKLKFSCPFIYSQSRSSTHNKIYHHF